MYQINVLKTENINKKTTDVCTKEDYDRSKSKGMTHDASIAHSSILDMIASWTVDIALDMYLSGNDYRPVEAGPWMKRFCHAFRVAVAATV